MKKFKLKTEDLYDPNLIYYILPAVIDKEEGRVIYKRMMIGTDKAMSGLEIGIKNKPFFASLIPTKVKGNYILLEDNMSVYQMSLKELQKVLLCNVMTYPLSGYFTVIKSNSNYSLRYLGYGYEGDAIDDIIEDIVDEN